MYVRVLAHTYINRFDVQMNYPLSCTYSWMLYTDGDGNVVSLLEG